MKEKLITICKYDLKYNYYARDNGEIYSEKSNKILSYQLDKNGYAKVQMMSTDGKRHRYSVHRLILENFSPREDMHLLQVNHIDGNKLNNNLNNLEWCTNQENTRHAIRNNLRNNNGENNPSSKLKNEDVYEIIKLIKDGYSCAKIAKQYNVNASTIERIKNKKSWISLTEDLIF